MEWSRFYFYVHIRNKAKCQITSKKWKIGNLDHFFFNLISKKIKKHAAKLNKKTSGNHTVDADGDAFVGAAAELFKGIWGQRLWPCVWPWLLVCLLWFLAIAALRISWRAVSLQLALITGHFGSLQLSLLLPPITFTLYRSDIINGKTTAEDKASFKAGESEKSAKSDRLCSGQYRSGSVPLPYHDSAELKLHSSFTFHFGLNVSFYNRIQFNCTRSRLQVC